MEGDEKVWKIQRGLTENGQGRWLLLGTCLPKPGWTNH